MAKSVRKLKEKLRQYGLITLVKRVVKHVLAKAGYKSESFLYCIFDLERNSKEPFLAPGYSVRKLTMEDFTRYSGISFSEDKLSLFGRRFASGKYSPYGAFFESRLVYYSWISTYEIEPIHPGVRQSGLQLKDDEGYMLDSFCDTAHRGKGLHQYMIWYQFRELQQMGKRKAAMMVDKDNRSARKSMAKMGFSVSRGLSHKDLFGKQRTESYPLTTAL